MSQYGSITHISGFRSEPTINKECQEAVWTQGASCKDCAVICYRVGWTKLQATLDNEQKVVGLRKSSE